MHSHVGQSEKNMDSAINMIKACAPCVLLIDEIEKVFGGVSSSNQVDGGTLNRVMGSLLSFLSGEESKDVFCIMTSNNTVDLPPELTRAGRISAKWYFDLPDLEERKEIFKIHFNKTPIQVGEDIIDFAASRTEHYTGAEIKEIVTVSLTKAFNRYLEDGNKTITIDDVTAAIPEVIPVYESDKENIEALQTYSRGRARFTNEMPKTSVPTTHVDEEDLFL